ncbi:hypothetical protein ACN267_18315 [Micromonospora sp. WMMD734]|uniref:Bacterial Death-like domain-containing protein n=1 Tax=Micromonospora humidisoli TaxID=2807622 RepID=A0ABS2J7A8_9ACTN|nr:hypothetical protein [Micromonospora humidisoli]MBM7081329.1 hypothetical protein [Micromonospora humidisoli]
MQVCRALHRDWADLAEYFEIPPSQRARFDKGREASAVWDWLESRKRLGELDGALRALGLAHCADLLRQA